MVMLIPLYVLAGGAVLAGLVAYNWFVGDAWQAFWGKSIAVASTKEILHHAHEVPTWVKLLPLVMAVSGIALSYYYYVVRPDLPGKTVQTFKALHTFYYNKWYFDELYDKIFVRPSMAIGRFFWKKGDGATIDGLGPDGIAARAKDLAAALVRFQSGYLYHYAFVMLIGVAGLVTYFMLSR
jgi:NADH-quinone oxidoreductase subunit L